MRRRAFALLARAKTRPSIEGSKVFSKELMKKYHIPTAAYEVFENSADAVKYLEKSSFPAVIKAEGLALGKGVIIAKSFDEAKEAVVKMMEDKAFGAAGNRVVIEEFLTGPEISVLAFTDGKTIVPMVSSQDHKRAKDNDEGLNTGRHGSVFPQPHLRRGHGKNLHGNHFPPHGGRDEPGGGAPSRAFCTLA